jgi:hypothetical protein
MVKATPPSTWDTWSLYSSDSTTTYRDKGTTGGGILVFTPDSAYGTSRWLKSRTTHPNDREPLHRLGICMRVCPTEVSAAPPPYSEIAKRRPMGNGTAETGCGAHVGKHRRGIDTPHKVNHSEPLRKRLTQTKRGGGLRNWVSRLEGSLVAPFYAWSMAEAQTGTGGEVRPSTPDRQAGGLTAGQKPAG